MTFEPELPSMPLGIALPVPSIEALPRRLSVSTLRGSVKSTDPELAAQFGVAARLVRFYNPDHAGLLADEPGARNLELYPVFVGADVDFIIGGQVAQIPDFRTRLKEIPVPVMVLAGRYDRALYPALQRQFVQYAPQIRLEFLERSGSFSHVEEPEAVFALIRDFTGPV